MGDQPADDFIARVSAMAEELGLTGDDRNDYINRHAKAKGYTMVPTWVKESGDDDKSSGFFGGGKSREGGRKDGGWFPSD